MEMIMFIGLQGSGKSTYYQAHFSDTHLRINLDMLRTRRREDAVLQACLDSGQRCVIDNTSPSDEERAGYIAKAKDKHFATVAYVFNVPFDVCLQRNSARHGKRRIPDQGIKATAKKLTAPNATEGFDQVFHVDEDGHATQVWPTDEI